MAVKFPDWWSVLARGERCLRLMDTLVFPLTVCLDELLYLLFLLPVSTLLRPYPINLSGGEQLKVIVEKKLAVSVCRWLLACWSNIKRVRPFGVQMRISALDEETPCFVCLLA
ncbi:hypothetical protein F2Q70_00013234 [Brassica cretica]|uniref:Uncharacterized protein n=1 Tax=Brassica cretica TaxID=69181 RepID=A0A8S9M8G5_BRACR|nr:hypothetical protein F2Q70_00013234 [Brassica cretica]